VWVVLCSCFFAGFGFAVGDECWIRAEPGLDGIMKR
jgi:hypothetical protein